MPYLWCSWSEASPSRWAEHVTVSQGRLLPETVVLKANTPRRHGLP
jgi:hypothetical protein